MSIVLRIRRAIKNLGPTFANRKVPRVRLPNICPLPLLDIGRLGLDLRRLWLINITFIVFVLSSIFLHCTLDRLITIQILLVEDAVFNVFEFVEGFNDCSFLTDVDLAAAFFYFFQALVLAVQLLLLEVGYTSRGTVVEF